MTEPQIHALFPTPIVKTNIGRDFTDAESLFVMEHSKDTVTNMGNTTSRDNYIFKQDIMKDLHDKALSAVKWYMDNVMKTKNSVTPYVTQSWLNYTRPGEYHHKHQHPNSFLSGVIYLNADPKKDKIFFYTDEYKQIKPEITEWTWHNSSSWWFEVGTGDIMIFPSSLTHMVEQTQSDETRISLAFNTFLTGKIGINSELTELLNP